MSRSYAIRSVVRGRARIARRSRSRLCTAAVCRAFARSRAAFSADNASACLAATINSSTAYWGRKAFSPGRQNDRFRSRSGHATCEFGAIPSRAGNKKHSVGFCTRIMPRASWTRRRNAGSDGGSNRTSSLLSDRAGRRPGSGCCKPAISRSSLRGESRIADRRAGATPAGIICRIRCSNPVEVSSAGRPGWTRLMPGMSFPWPGADGATANHARRQRTRQAGPPPWCRSGTPVCSARVSSHPSSTVEKRRSWP